MRHITHTDHQEAYLAGWEAMTVEIREMGFAAARDKFNMENPIGDKPKNLGAYYYACGGIGCLAQHI